MTYSSPATEIAILRAALIQAASENAQLRTAIGTALSMLHNPYDGGEYEDGEMPVVDVLRRVGLQAP